MLNKEICRHCRSTIKHLTIVNARDWTEYDVIEPWIATDNDRWEAGFVRCKYGELYKMADIKNGVNTTHIGESCLIHEKPPKHCPFVLEHLMEQQHAE
jgi:hypothetical protein